MIQQSLVRLRDVAYKVTQDALKSMLHTQIAGSPTDAMGHPHTFSLWLQEHHTFLILHMQMWHCKNMSGLSVGATAICRSLRWAVPAQVYSGQGTSASLYPDRTPSPPWEVCRLRSSIWTFSWKPFPCSLTCFSGWRSQVPADSIFRIEISIA